MYVYLIIIAIVLFLLLLIGKLFNHRKQNKGKIANTLLLFLPVLVVFCAYQVIKDRPVTDYSKVENWIKFESSGNKTCDVFFAHPTSYIGISDGFNAKLTTESTNQSAEDWVNKMTGVFAEQCNVYAPRYQQSSIAVLMLPVKYRKRFLDVAHNDIEQAYKYYIKNLNKGKPYIIAGHSQGTNVTKNMLVKNPSLINKNKLIAYYAIGFTVTQDDVDQIGIPLASNATQVPSIITWNTIGKGGKSPVIEPNALAVNPLDWTTSKTNQGKEKNSLANIKLRDGTNKEIPHFTSAQIDENGALVIPTPTILDQLDMDMGDEVYHVYDYDFFYGNLKENVKQRVQAWKEKHPTD